MAVFTYVMVGFVVGCMAHLVMRRHSSMRFLPNVSVGIVGGLAGGGLFPRLGLPNDHGMLDFLVMSYLGAATLLLLLNLFASRPCAIKRKRVRHRTDRSRHARIGAICARNANAPAARERRAVREMETRC